MLNNIARMKKIDPDDMHSLIVGFPNQLAEGLELGKAISLDSIDTKSIANIVLLGMGGSAIGGDMLRYYLGDELPVPFYVNRTYSIPAFVGVNSLVIVSSYSGNTEETLTAFSTAQKRGAQFVCITSGGKVGEIASDKGYAHIALPGGLPPRAALGYSFTPLLVVLSRLGFVKDKESEIAEAGAGLRAGALEYQMENPEEKNPAKQLARKLHNKLPIIYTATKLMGVVGVRIRGQIEENAKMLAYSAELPEMNHNELVGWRHIETVADVIQPVFVRDRDDNPRVAFRMNFVSSVMKEFGVNPIQIETRGNTVLARLLSAVQLGDFASYYLAILNEENPMPVRVIDRLKSSLAEFKN